VEQRPGIGVAKIKLKLVIKQQSHNILMLDQAAFGFTGGAGGVDDVGEIRRLCFGLRVLTHPASSIFF
jgi:hypothetical protein